MAKKDIMDLVRNKKAAIQASSGRKEKTHKPGSGKNRYRILPGWRGAEDPTFFHDFGQHFIKDVHDQLKAVYICSEKTFGKPCAVCEAINEGAAAADSDEVINALKESRSKGRVLLNALHLDGDDKNAPVILDLTPTTFERVLELMEEYGNITDLDEGVDIIINRSGKGLNTEYSVMPAPKSNPVDKSVLKNLHNLDDYVKQEYDEGKAKALGAVGNVSGLLAGPSDSTEATGSDRPRAKPRTDFDDDVPASEGSLDAEYSVDDEAPAPAAKKAAAGGAPVDGAMSDDDLDSLLADLGD